MSSLRYVCVKLEARVRIPVLPLFSFFLGPTSISSLIIHKATIVARRVNYIIHMSPESSTCTCMLLLNHAISVFSRENCL